MKQFRVAPLLLAGLMTAGLISGCDAQKQETQSVVSEHEIITLEPPSEEKISITMRGEDNINVALIEEALETEFPELDIIFINNTQTQCLLEKDFEDLFLPPYAFYFTEADPENTFLDLSDKAFLSNYDLSVLNNCEHQGQLYYLPGLSNVQGIVYDRELFLENGWETPHSLTEFMELCETINAARIRAYQPSLVYNNSIKLHFTVFNYSSVFAGVDNYNWLQDFRIGEATMSGHMEPAFERMQELLDAGVYRPGDFEVKPGERSVMMYKDHTCAMTHGSLASSGDSVDIGGEFAAMNGISMTRPYVTCPYILLLNENLNEESIRGRRLAFAKYNTYQGPFIGVVVDLQYGG